jgi:putative hydrolase of HD superfamily
MAMVFAEQLGCDRDKLTKMAIIHDLAEVITGDIVSEHGNMIDLEVRQKKELMEAQGIEAMFTPLENKDEYIRIFNEMLQRKSHESNMFWQLDKLEMAIQALVYEKSDKKILAEFFINTDLQLTHPFLRSVFAHVIAARPPKKK